MDSLAARAQPIVRAERTAAAVSGATLLLAALKAAVGYSTGATLLIADAAHSGADLLALGASWFGLRLSRRSPTTRFPYGFYRAETLATLLIAGVIAYIGARLMVEGIATLRDTSPLQKPWLALGTAISSAAVGAALALWEKRVSKATGSQSLAATADEAVMDAVSSLVVFVALLAGTFSVPYITGAATILISLAVLRVAVYHGWLALLTLMDASVNPELERSVKAKLQSIREVRTVHKVRARRSGPYYFIEGHLHVDGSMDVTRSHALSHHAEVTIRAHHPRVEAVILHVEPYHSARRHVLVPAASAEGMDALVSTHFGRAPRFVIATVELEKVAATAQMENPFGTKKVRAGLAVINRLVRKEELDAVLVSEIGEIAYYALRDNSIEIYRVGETTVRAAVDAYMAGDLPPLLEPTHSSDERLPS